MAITNKRNNYPNLIPAFNPAYIYFDSTNKTEDNFTYLITITDDSDNILTSYNRRPRPNDNFAEVDISKILQSQVKPHFNPNITDVEPNDEQLFKYKIKVGEEYLYSWSFDDYFFSADYQGGNTGLTGSTNHGFLVGDIITVQLPTVHNDLRDNLNGTWVVIGVPSASEIVINCFGIGSGPATPGLTTFADNQPSSFPNLLTINNLSSIYSTIPFSLYNSYDENLYKLNNSAPANLWTDLPDNYSIQPHNILILNYFDNISATTKYITFTMNNGDKYRYQDTTPTQTTYKRFLAVPTTDNIEQFWNGTTWVSYMGTFDLNLYTDYTITIESSTTVLTVPKTIKIDKSCSYSPDATLYFIDRKGSYIPFNFKKYRVNQNITKEEMRLKYSDINIDNNWTYSESESGLNNNHIEENINLSLTSYRLKDLTMYKQLMSSGDVYLLSDDYQYRKVIITDTQSSLPTHRNEKNIVKTVNVKLAINDNINNL